MESLFLALEIWNLSKARMSQFFRNLSILFFFASASASASAFFFAFFFAYAYAYSFAYPF